MRVVGEHEMTSEIKQEYAHAVRFLAIDAVNQAQSGHPGMPMGMADIATVLWKKHLQYSPLNPNWFNRDRFILSNGHGVMLQYALLHLTGFDVSLDDIKQFRQLHSKTPGHPEVGDTPGIETTTGPLGQGLANGVGMALAEQCLAATFNQPQFPIVDHHTYVFVGDGCLMEGISHEVCSLAGTLGLGKLIVIYDDNGISIDGNVAPWFSEDVAMRFKAYDWQVIEGVDGHHMPAVDQALSDAKKNVSKPTIICCQTQIGYGSPNKVGTAGVHGSPLGAKETQLAREALSWPHSPFHIPEEIYQALNHQQEGQEQELIWNQLFAAYEQQHPTLAAEFLRRQYGALPASWQQNVSRWLSEMQAADVSVASRKASQLSLEKIASVLPELMGGSADLSGSNCTHLPAFSAVTRDNFKAQYINYGVREFGMAAIMNGLALHGGFLPYGGTFLVFSDYSRNALRLRALMKVRAISVLTHDSIGLGEDGPTHQPIEQAGSLRMIPGLNVWRPADAVETMAAWSSACAYQGPSALLLSRQTLPAIPRDEGMLSLIERGAYVVFEAANYDAIMIATGSEVSLALEAAKQLMAEGLPVRVVSMPCCDVFAAQDLDYQESILPLSHRARVSVEAGCTDGWMRWVGLDGVALGIDRFGLSAPAQEVFNELGITVEAITAAVKRVVAS